MPDIQIRSTSGATTPEDYIVPGTVTLTPKLVHVDYVDNSASGDWLPCVTFISDAGVVLGQAVDQGVVVTAGNDASVSFFPGVKAASAAPATASTEYALAYTDYIIGPNTGTQLVPAGTNRGGALNNASTTNSSVMAWSNVGNAPTRIQLTAHGVYLIQAFTLWNTVNDLTDSFVLSTSQTDIPHADFDTNSVMSTQDDVGPTNKQDYTVAHITGSPALYNLEHTNNDVADNTVLKQWLSVIYLPTS